MIEIVCCSVYPQPGICVSAGCKKRTLGSLFCYYHGYSGDLGFYQDVIDVIRSCSEEIMISNAFYGYVSNKWWWPICACTLKYILVDDTNWDDLLFWDVERGCSLEVVSTFNFETFILTNTVYYEQNN